MDEFPGRYDRKKTAAASDFRVRAHFYAIRQVDGERAYDWYRRVRAAAVPCGFDVVNQPQWTPIVDKFVTGLRPGPVADRLLGERADGRLDVLLAAAVEAEAASAADGASRLPAAGASHLPAAGASPDLLAEIREGLKLYRYSGDGYERGLISDGGGDDRSHDYKHKSSQMSNINMVGNMKSTIDGKSWWKQRIEKNDYTPLTCKNGCKLATKRLGNVQENTNLYHRSSTSINHEKPFSDDYKSTSYFHDDSKCYCSLPTNNDRKVNNVTPIGVGKSKKTISISNCSDCTKNIKCYICNFSG